MLIKAIAIVRFTTLLFCHDALQNWVRFSHFIAMNLIVLRLVLKKIHISQEQTPLRRGLFYNLYHVIGNDLLILHGSGLLEGFLF